jgi:flagellar biosynthesis protein FlhB
MSFVNCEGGYFWLISKNSSGTYSAQLKLKFWAILWIIYFFFSKDESAILIFQQQQPKKLSKKTKQVFRHFWVAVTFAFYILVLMLIINFRQFCLTPFSAFS